VVPDLVTVVLLREVKEKAPGQGSIDLTNIEETSRLRIEGLNAEGGHLTPSFGRPGNTKIQWRYSPPRTSYWRYCAALRQWHNRNEPQIFLSVSVGT
jgi:hypothetical protein